MNINIKKTAVFILLSVVIAFESTFALTFNDLALTLDNTFEVQNAELQKINAQNTIDLYKNPEDISFSLNPGVNLLTETGGTFPGETNFTGTLSVKIPVGLSAEEKEKLDFARDALIYSSESLDSTKRKTFANFYSLYQEAWLLQEEKSVLHAELDAAESKAANLQSQYAEGTLALTALTIAQEELRIKQEEYSQELTKQKISWYELSFTTNTLIKDELLERFELPMGKLPTPPELSVTAFENDPDLEAQKRKIEQIQKTVSRLKNQNFSMSVKPYLGIEDHSVSLEYSNDNPVLYAAYSFPVYTIGELPVQGNTSNSTWNTGITFSLAYKTANTDKWNSSILLTNLQQENARLDYMQNLLNLKIRSEYQQYLKSLDLLEQSKRDLDRSSENKKIIETKTALGQTSEYERKESDANILRSAWRVESARIEIEKAYLNIALASSWGEFYE